MDDKFLETLNSMSQGMLDEHQQLRPETAHHHHQIPLVAATARIPSAYGGGGRPPSGIGGRNSSSSFIDSSSEVTTLASYRPESAFVFNRPRTGRRPNLDRGDAQELGGMPPSKIARQPSSRPRSTFRRNDESDSYIPDLDEVREDDLTMTVASAPSYELQRMASLNELDAELSQTKALSVVDGVNLRKLCKFLVPEKELGEADELWSWDRLYNEVISNNDLNHLVRFQKKDESDFDSLTMK